MKLGAVPTSPKLHHREKVVHDLYAKGTGEVFDQPIRSSRKSLALLLLVVPLGIVSGFLGGVLTMSWDENLKKASLTKVPKIVIERPENSRSVSDKKFQESFLVLRSSVVTIVSKKNLKTPSQNPTDFLYRASERKGNGVILTDDGYLVTAPRVIEETSDEIAVITADQKVYPATSILRDPITNAIFLKIEAKNLSPVTFRPPEETKVGDRVVSIKNKENGAFEAMMTTIVDLRAPMESEQKEVWASTEILTDWIKVSDPFSQDYRGAPIFTQDGKFEGLIAESHDSSSSMTLILPSRWFHSLLPRLLKEGMPRRAFLGVHYLNVSDVVYLPASFRQNQEQGALVDGDLLRGILPVVPQSPLVSHQVARGDLILKVNGRSVDKNHPLNELIQELGPRDRIEILILRDGKEQEIMVELGEFKATMR